MLLIPGTSYAAHLRENAAAGGIELPAEAVAALNAVGIADRSPLGAALSTSVLAVPGSLRDQCA